MNSPGSYSCQCPSGAYFNNEECVSYDGVPQDDPECGIPEFIKRPHTRYDITLGEEVVIECEGDTGDVVYWTKGLDRVKLNRTESERISSLRFSAIKKKEIDVYTCVVLNKCTKLTKVTQVDLHAKMDPCVG